MIEHISGEIYPNEVVCAGNECMGTVELESYGINITSSEAVCESFYIIRKVK